LVIIQRDARTQAVAEQVGVADAQAGQQGSSTTGTVTGSAVPRIS